MFIFDLLIIFVIFYFLSKLFWPRRSYQPESYDQLERSDLRKKTSTSTDMPEVSIRAQQPKKVTRRNISEQSGRQPNGRPFISNRKNDGSYNRPSARAQSRYEEYYEEKQLGNDRASSRRSNYAQTDRRYATSLERDRKLMEEGSPIYSKQMTRKRDEDPFASMNDFTSMNDFSDMEFQDEESLKDKLALDITQSQVSEVINLQAKETSKQHSERSKREKKKLHNLRQAVIWSEILQAPKSMRK